MRSFLADLVLIVHFCLAAYIALGLAAIWLGRARGWRWVRNLRFRVLHAVAMLVVTAESIVGITCPLTRWEDVLRGARTDTSFVARWIGRLLYYDVPEPVFTLLYALTSIATIAAWFAVPPRRSKPRRTG
jgi:hypothetical protein